MAVVGYSRLHRSRLTSALLAALLAPVAGGAFAQETAPANVTQNDEATEVDAVVVTGSRIKRANVEGPSPVTVITAADIEKQGFTTVYDALNTLTQATGQVQNELTTNGFTPNANIVNLRGLGPGRTLVLVNGRRVAEYPLPYNSQSNFVNLASIPAAAVERIEVLSGGASAIYGSDAVAGVLNVITKTNYEGDEVSVRGGTTSRGGGDTFDAQWVGGKTGDNWNVTYAFEYLNREPIYANQREFMDSRLDNPNPALRTPVGGLILFDELTGSYVDITDGGATCDRFFGHFSVRATGAGRRCGQFDYPAFQTVRSSDNNKSAYVSASYDFSNGMQAFADVNWWSSKARYASGLQFWSETFYDLNADTFYTTQRIFQVEETGAGALDVHSQEDSWNGTVGLRGNLFDNRFDWEATYSHSEYKTDVKFNRLLAQASSQYFLGERLGTLFGQYGIYSPDYTNYLTPMTPEQFASISATLNPQADSEADSAVFSLSGDLFQLPAGAVGFATVLEAGHQEYSLRPDPRTLPSADPSQAAYNYSDTGGGGERSKYALGVEFSIPILDSLKASLAARYDKYDDVTEVDDAITWNGGLEWRPVDSFLVRGSYATSFRAPDMHYVFADESGFFSSNFDEYACRRDNDNDWNVCDDIQSAGDDPDYTYTIAGIRQGNFDLEEEEAKSWTAGFVWDVVDNLSIQADYYNIEIEGGVNDLDQGFLMRKEADCRLGVDRNGAAVDVNSAQCSQYLALIERFNAPGTTFDGEIDTVHLYPLNTAIEKTKGIDASVKYRLDTDRLGEFNFGLNWSHTLAYSFTQYEEDGPDPDQDRDSLRHFDFRSRISGNMTWEKGDWNSAIFFTRWGSLPNWAETGRIAPYFLWNANVTKKITDKATVGFYVNNIFDKLHPRDDTFDTYPYFWRAYSPVGRELFVQFNYKFH